jgi:hypothetical protein
LVGKRNGGGMNPGTGLKAGGLKYGGSKLLVGGIKPGGIKPGGNPTFISGVDFRLFICCWVLMRVIPYPGGLGRILAYFFILAITTRG